METHRALFQLIALVGLFFTPSMPRAQSAPDGNAPPVLVSFAPRGGSGFRNQYIEFTTVYSDTNGAADLAVVQFLMNTSNTSVKGLNTIYDEDNDELYLRLPSGAGVVGPCTPGEDTRLKTDTVRLNCLNTAVTRNGDTLTVVWQVMFLKRLAGRYGKYNAYLFATDAANSITGFTKKGTWTLNK